MWPKCDSGSATWEAPNFLGVAEKCQRGGNRIGRFLAPLTRRGRWLRDTLLSRKPLMDLMLRLGRDQATVDLPDYPA